MREIKFRGKSKVTDEWVYGDLFQHGEQRFIMANNRNTEVDSETVGQYIGLKDKNGKEIYEGDICKAALYGFTKEFDAIGIINFNDGGFAFENEYGKFYIYNVVDENFEVIGNVYDNPGLLEECNNEEKI